MQINPSTNINISKPLGSSSSLEIYDVVVIGAGPVGLATAIGLRQRGIENILLIDQTRAFRQVGQVIDLLPNGLKAIKALDFAAYEAVKKEGMTISPLPSNNQTTQATQKKPAPASRQWVQINLQGQPIQSISLEYDDWLQEYGEGRVSISWYNLQTTLRNLLPYEQVRVNHRCVDVVDDFDTGCVRIDCLSDLGTEVNPYAQWIESPQQDKLELNSEQTSGQSGKQSLYAKLVVGADGINSQVRRRLYRDRPYEKFAFPEYSGFAAVGCMGLTEVPDGLMTELQSKFFRNSPIVTVVNDRRTKDCAKEEKPRIILIHRPDGSLGYILHLPLPLSALKEISGSKLIDKAVQELERADFPDSLKQVVRLANSANLISRPYYIHRATLKEEICFPSTAHLHQQDDALFMPPPWSKGRVVLVGDAAHGMPPFMAQGANQGLEDALAISTLIAKINSMQDWDNTQAIESALENYEQLRRPLMAYIQKVTLEKLARTAEEHFEYEKQVYHRNFDQVLEALENFCK